MRIHIPVSGAKRKVMIASIAAMPILSVGGVAYAATLHSGTTAPSPAVTQPAANTSQGAETPGVNDSPDTPGVNDPAEAPDTPGAHDTDGPGGHQDPNGVNVDHQFDGQE